MTCDLHSISPAAANVDFPDCSGSSLMERVGDQRRDRLSVQTLRGLRVAFEKMGTRLSPEMWAAIQALAETMEAMAEERAEYTFYLSSLDPGVGKTTTVVHFIRALMASPEHTNVSAVIGVARLSEIPRLIEEMGLSRADVGVLTSDPEFNALGREDHHKARVLLTTQQMLMSRLRRGRSFSILSEFHFNGSPRQVRIWDEAMSPGETLAVTRDSFAGLLEALRGVFPDVADELERFFFELGGKQDLEMVSVPDLEKLHGVTQDQVLAVLLAGSGAGTKVGNSDLQEKAAAIWRLGGRLVTVRHDGLGVVTVLDYEDILPDDFMPVLILDASGRVKRSYQLWEEHRGNLKRLPAALKRYDNLRIHLWSTASGKSAFFDPAQQHKLIEGIAKAVNSKPGERFLVVHHKYAQRGLQRLDVVGELGPLIAVPKLKVRQRDPDKGEMEDQIVDRVRFIHWGDHKATNEFRDIPNVVLAGILFRPNSAYEAATRLAKGARSGELVERSEVERVKFGELNDDILQAACRGLLRQCVDGGCPPSSLYLIAAAKTGIKGQLPLVFPGAKIVTWAPITTPLKGKVKLAVEYLQKRFDDDPDQIVTFREVMKAIGVSTSQTFAKDIRKHSRFMDAIAQLGIVEYAPKKRRVGFKMEEPLFVCAVDEGNFLVEHLEGA